MRLGWVMGIAVIVSAPSYAEAQSSYTVTPSPAAPGARVAMTGPSAQLTNRIVLTNQASRASYQGVVFGSSPSRVSFNVPSNAPDGTYSVSAYNVRNQLLGTSTISIARASAAPTPPPATPTAGPTAPPPPPSSAPARPPTNGPAPDLDSCGSFSPNSGPTSKTTTIVVGDNLAGATFFADGFPLTATPKSAREFVVTAPVRSPISPYGFIGATVNGKGARCPSPYQAEALTGRITPASGAAGTSVRVDVDRPGIACVGASASVYFAGVLAGTLPMRTDCVVDVQVPAAATTGPIVVLTAWGQATLGSFTVTGTPSPAPPGPDAAPIVVAIEGAPVRPGGQVKLRGYNLDRLTATSAGTVRAVSPAEAVLSVSQGWRSGPLRLYWSRGSHYGPVLLRDPLP